MRTNRIPQHTRINDIFLGPLERPALRWLAARMPAWVTPDSCTLVGVAGALLTATGYGLSNLHPGFLWLASLGFIINWLGDSLDGTLARFRRVERPSYGYFVDHTTDLLCQTMILMGLGSTPFVSFHIACLMLISYLLLSGMVYLRTYVSGEFKISYGGWGPTESRAVAILLNTVMYFLGVQQLHVFNFVISIYDIAVITIALVLFSFFLNTAAREVRRLAAMGK
jgi:phosphatidylglycerophosphate synthase